MGCHSSSHCGTRNTIYYTFIFPFQPPSERPNLLIEKQIATAVTAAAARAARELLWGTRSESCIPLFQKETKIRRQPEECTNDILTLTLRDTARKIAIHMTYAVISTTLVGALSGLRFSFPPLSISHFNLRPQVGQVALRTLLKKPPLPLGEKQ